MNLIILNKTFGTYINSKEAIFYSLKENSDYEELKKLIIENNPKNIISIDFGIQTSKVINNNTIAIGKESIMISSKPIDWSVPRADKWLESSERLNFNICKMLEENCIQHVIASSAQLKYSQNIKKRKRAIRWIQKKIKVTLIDNNSAEILKIIYELNLNNKYTFLRLINNKYQIINHEENNFFKKIIFYINSIVFTKFYVKKILTEINEKKIIIQLSKIN